MRKQSTINLNVIDSQKLSVFEKAIYMLISTYQTVSKKTIGKTLLLSESIVDISIQTLSEMNLIKVTKRGISIKTNNDFKNFIDTYFKLYNDKAFEIKGSRENSDGKPYYPKWGQKEGDLLKKDLEDYGYKSLSEYAIIFFYDKIESITQFTKKAGYGYNVFHSVIDKLQMANIKIPAPCSVCGRYWGHTKDCEYKIKLTQKKDFEILELKKLKEQYQNISLKEMFNKKLGRQIV